MANNDITWVRPEHRAACAVWKKIRDFCKGAEAVKAAGNNYLPLLDPTDKSMRNRRRNDDYLSRAVFYAITGNTKIGLLGLAFRKDPTFSAPEKLSYLLKNADGAGTSIYQQSQLVTENVLEVARDGLYVDYAEGSGQAIILRYLAENIINWRTKRINGRDRLVLVVLRECVEKENGYAFEDEIQYRELVLVNGVFICRVWRRSGESGSGAYAVTSEYQPKPKGKDSWDEIPFTFVGAQNNDPAIDDSPLAALVEINHGHYATDGDFKGTVYANKIVGDVVNMFSFPGGRYRGDPGKQQDFYRQVTWAGGVPYDVTIAVPTFVVWNESDSYNAAMEAYVNINGRNITVAPLGLRLSYAGPNNTQRQVNCYVPVTASLDIPANSGPVAIRVGLRGIANGEAYMDMQPSMVLITKRNTPNFSGYSGN